MKYLVAQEIKSETKMGKSIYLFDFFFLIFYMSVSLVLANLVHPSYKVVFLIYSFIMALTLTSKSFYNKKRRNYESIAIMFRRDMNVYYPVKNVSKATEAKEEE